MSTGQEILHYFLLHHYLLKQVMAQRECCDFRLMETKKMKKEEKPVLHLEKCSVLLLKERMNSEKTRGI